MKAESLKHDTVGSALSILYQPSRAAGRAIDGNKLLFVQTIFDETMELTGMHVLNTFVIT
jgi:hypothetical protein